MNEPNLFSHEIRMVRRVLKRVSAAALAVAGLYWLSTCFVPVKVQESGVVLRFGKVIRPRVEPGLTLKLPWPIDRMERVPTRMIKRLTVGFGADRENIEEFEGEFGSIDEMENATLLVPYALTGDKNILHLKVILGYKIGDPVKYLIHALDADKMLKLLAQQAILNSLSTYTVDLALTRGKLDLRGEVMSFLSGQTGELGLEIVSVEIKNVRPPAQTADAFKDVVNAQEERRRLVHEAVSYRNKILPEARASAEQSLQEAAAFHNRKVDHARGQAERFSLLAAQHTEEPGLTRERLRLEALEEILPSANKFLADSGVQDGKIRLRLWDKDGSPEIAATGARRIGVR